MDAFHNGNEDVLLWTNVSSTVAARSVHENGVAACLDKVEAFSA